MVKNFNSGRNKLTDECIDSLNKIEPAYIAFKMNLMDNPISEDAIIKLNSEFFITAPEDLTGVDFKKLSSKQYSIPRYTSKNNTEKGSENDSHEKGDESESFEMRNLQTQLPQKPQRPQKPSQNSKFQPEPPKLPPKINEKPFLEKLFEKRKSLDESAQPATIQIKSDPPLLNPEKPKTIPQPPKSPQNKTKPKSKEEFLSQIPEEKITNIKGSKIQSAPSITPVINDPKIQKSQKFENLLKKRNDEIKKEILSKQSNKSLNSIPETKEIQEPKSIVLKSPSSSTSKEEEKSQIDLLQHIDSKEIFLPELMNSNEKENNFLSEIENLDNILNQKADGIGKLEEFFNSYQNINANSSTNIKIIHEHHFKDFPKIDEPNQKKASIYPVKIEHSQAIKERLASGLLQEIKHQNKPINSLMEEISQNFVSGNLKIRSTLYSKTNSTRNETLDEFWKSNKNLETEIKTILNELKSEDTTTMKKHEKYSLYWSLYLKAIDNKGSRAGNSEVDKVLGLKKCEEKIENIAERMIRLGNEKKLKKYELISLMQKLKSLRENYKPSNLCEEVFDITSIIKEEAKLLSEYDEFIKKSHKKLISLLFDLKTKHKIYFEKALKLKEMKNSSFSSIEKVLIEKSLPKIDSAISKYRQEVELIENQSRRLDEFLNTMQTEAMSDFQIRVDELKIERGQLVSKLSSLDSDATKCERIKTNIDSVDSKILQLENESKDHSKTMEETAKQLQDLFIKADSYKDLLKMTFPFKMQDSYSDLKMILNLPFNRFLIEKMKLLKENL